jgi:hypothetical protein
MCASSRTDPERIQGGEHHRTVGAGTGLHETRFVGSDEVDGVELACAAIPVSIVRIASAASGWSVAAVPTSTKCRTGMSVTVAMVRIERGEPWSR